MELDAAGSRAAIARAGRASRSASTLNEAAAAIMAVATEQMVQAIEEITVNQGVDPRTRGARRRRRRGGAERGGDRAPARLAARRDPAGGRGAERARGADVATSTSEYAAALFTGSDDFDHDGAQAVLDGLRERCEQFAERIGAARQAEIEFVAEARYRHQVWELEVRLRAGRARLGAATSAQLVEDFHAIHEEVYAVRDERAVVEVVNLRARVNCPLQGGVAGHGGARARAQLSSGMRRVYFSGIGAVNAAILRLEAMAPGERSSPGRRSSSRRSRRSCSNPGATRRTHGERQPGDRAAATLEPASAGRRAGDEGGELMGAGAAAARRGRAGGDDEPHGRRRAQDDEHAVPHRRARACSTPRATSRAASSRPTTSCSRWPRACRST